MYEKSRRSASALPRPRIVRASGSRHKAALFLTVVVTGACLLLGAGAKESAGIALLGLALTWAFGSDERVVHWLFVIVGVALACLTAALTWRTYDLRAASYARAAAAFERRMPELARRYPLNASKDVIAGIIFPDRPPQFWDEARAAGLNLSAVPSYELPGNPPEPFRVWTLIAWPLYAFSTLLCVLGLGLVVGIRPKPRSC